MHLNGHALSYLLDIVQINLHRHDTGWRRRRQRNNCRLRRRRRRRRTILVIIVVMIAVSPGIGHYRPPRVHRESMAQTDPFFVVPSILRRRQDVTLRFDRSCLQKSMPMRSAGGYRKGTGYQQHIDTQLSQRDTLFGSRYRVRSSHFPARKPDPECPRQRDVSYCRWPVPLPHGREMT